MSSLRVIEALPIVALVIIFVDVVAIVVTIGMHACRTLALMNV